MFNSTKTKSLFSVERVFVKDEPVIEEKEQAITEQATGERRGGERIHKVR